MKRTVTVLAFVLFTALTMASNALAAPLGYIDPNTGGMIAQVLMVILAGISGFFYVFKNRLVMTWNRITRSEEEEETAVLNEMSEATDLNEDQPQA